MDTFQQNINKEMNLTVWTLFKTFTSTLPLAAILMYLDNIHKFMDTNYKHNVSQLLQNLS